MRVVSVAPKNKNEVCYSFNFSAILFFECFSEMKTADFVPGVEEESDLIVGIVEARLEAWVVKHGKVSLSIVARDEHPLPVVHIGQPRRSVHCKN